MIETPVLIIGAGPAGVALAQALGARGIRSLLVEQAPQLEADLAADPGITLRPGWYHFGFERFEDGVTAHLLEVGGERQQQVRADWLVGCDGADSRIRHFLDLDPEDLDPARGPPGRGRVRLAGAAAGPRAIMGPDPVRAAVEDALRVADQLAAAAD